MNREVSIRLLKVLAVSSILTSYGCVLNPEKTFEYVYGTQRIGKSITELNEKIGPPDSISTNERGYPVYSYAYPRYHPEKCTVFYEVVNDKIVFMTHKGPDCKQYN